MIPRLLRIREVMELVRKKQSSIYGAIVKGTFPAPLRLGTRSVAWLEKDIHNWILSRPRATYAEKSNFKGIKKMVRAAAKTRKVKKK